MNMRRREFLAGLAGSALIPSLSWAKQAPEDIRITRVVSFELELTRPKHIGKNAYRHDHGTKATDRVVRIYTNAGIDGFGTCWSGANECAALLGKSPFDFFHEDRRTVVSPLERYTTPLWDLAGKIMEKPVYELLGGQVREKVPVYDGSIYFTDLRPRFRYNWRDEFKRELEKSMAAGHRAFKIKIGRGKLWMRRDKGYERDVEVCQHIRQCVGPDVVLGVDANDGHTIESARRFIADTADLNIAFAEEMFPQDSAENYLAFKKYIHGLGLDTLVADGENKRRVDDMRAWVNAEAVDILQADMNLFGFEDILAEAAMARPHGIEIAPHNWGSLIGYYLQLQVGKAVPNFYRAEEDPLTSPAVDTSGYKLSKGESSVPDAPGHGLKLVENALPEAAVVHFDLKA